MRQEESMDGREEGIICQDDEGMICQDDEGIMQFFIEEQASDPHLLSWQMYYQMSPKFKEQIDNTYAKSDLAKTLSQQGKEALQIIQNTSKYIPSSHQVDTMWNKICQKIKNK